MENKNILDIHNSIIKTFEQDKLLCSNLTNRISELKLLLENETSYSTRLYQDINVEIQNLEERLSKISSEEEYYFYILMSTPILEKYKNTLEKPVQMNFMGEKSSIDCTELNQIYNEYMDIIRTIIPGVYINGEQQINKNCTTCNRVLEKIIDSTNTIACAYCGTEQESLKFTFSYKDTDRVNISTKYTYDRRLHFKECITQFQGKQNSTIKQEVYDKLIHQLKIHGLVLEDEKLPQHIRFQNVTKNHISLFLKEINCSHHYEDINLIYHNITGNELDDISHLEEILLNDFDKLSKLYDEEYIKTKKIVRKNFINTQYVLFQLLRRHKYPCNKNDFTFLKTIERKSFHDEICSELFKKLGWNFTCIF